MPTYEIYCSYHRSVYREWYRDQLDRPLFCRLGNHSDAVSDLPRALDLSRFPTYRELGRHYAEFELWFNMLWATRAGAFVLPEFVGFTQYDMEWYRGDESIADYCNRFKFAKHRVISFQPYSGSAIRQAGAHCPAAFAIARDLVSHHGIAFSDQEIDGSHLAMCDSVVLHRDVFVELCELCEILEQEIFSLNLDVQLRMLALTLERAVALWLLDRGLEISLFPVVHHFKGAV